MSPLPEALLELLSARRTTNPESRAAAGNPSWDSAAARILIVRLSPFADVERSSPHLLLFSELRAALPEAYLDFAFMPDRGDRALLAAAEKAARAGGPGPGEPVPPGAPIPPDAPLPWFPGLLSGRSPADFDLLMVSNSFSLELLNLPRLLGTAGIPLRASERREGPASGRRAARAPLVVLGGSNAGSCGSLLLREDGSEALVDGLFFGEGEGAIGELGRALTAPEAGAEARLGAAARVEGFLPLGPGFGGAAARRRILREAPRQAPPPPLFDGEESSTARLQIAAGCPGLCSFCLEGWDRRPYRERPLAELLEAARELRRRTGAETLEVMAFNFNTHEEVLALLFELNRIFRRVNFMSQRLDVLASWPALLRAELAAGKRSFTLGIEGISARMRARFRKGLSEEGLERLLDLLVAPGIRELKLFYILAGDEEAADLEDFAAFAARLGAARDERAPGLRVLASAGRLARLPFTPMMYAPLALEESAYRERAEACGRACEAAGIEWRMAADPGEYLADQLLALGGERLGPWLESGAGADRLFDGTLSRGAAESLRSFARGAGLLGRDFLGEKPAAWRPPLPFLEDEAGYDCLRAEYEAARAARDREPCLGGDCSACGACPDGEAVLAITGHAFAPPPEGHEARLGRLIAAKARLARLRVRLVLPPAAAGSSSAYRVARLLRLVEAASPGSESRLLGAEPAFPLPEGPFGLPEGAFGLSEFELLGPSLEGLRSLARAAGLEEAAPAGTGSAGGAAGRAGAVPPGAPGAAGAPPARLRVRVEFPPFLAEAARLAAEAGLPRPRGAPRPEPDPARAFGAWLAESGLAHVAEGPAESRRYAIPERDRRKGIVLEARRSEAAWELLLGPKARLSDWLGRLGPRVAELALVEVLGAD